MTLILKYAQSITYVKLRHREPTAHSFIINPIYHRVHSDRISLHQSPCIIPPDYLASSHRKSHLLLLLPLQQQKHHLLCIGIPTRKPPASTKPISVRIQSWASFSTTPTTTSSPGLHMIKCHQELRSSGWCGATVHAEFLQLPKRMAQQWMMMMMSSTA